MKIIICIVMLWLLSCTAVQAQGCLPQKPLIIIRGTTCPGCIYDYGDSVAIHGSNYLWAEIEFWTDSVYFEEAIPFELWQKRRLLLISDDVWGSTLCIAVRSFSSLREGIRRDYDICAQWHTQLYIEVVATEDPVLGQGIYIVTEIRIIDPFNGQQLGIEKYQ